MLQTARKTLEELDYVFVKGEARDRLHDRMHDAARRNSTSSKIVETEELEMNNNGLSNPTDPSKV